MKSRFSFSRGFTLLELLIVMTIIAILAGAIFAASQMAIRKARGAESKNIAVGLAKGITDFRDDYSRWPIPSGNSNQDVYKTKSDSAFIINLLGRDTSMNKRGRNFIDNVPMAKKGVSGLVVQGNSGDLFDAWGMYFDIHIDSDGNGQFPKPPEVLEGPSDLLLKIGVISPGVDKMMSGMNDDGVDAAKDNILSW